LEERPLSWYNPYWIFIAGGGMLATGQHSQFLYHRPYRPRQIDFGGRILETRRRRPARMEEPALDNMEIERERGITIKRGPCGSIIRRTTDRTIFST
jgi:hypothetical protein